MASQNELEWTEAQWKAWKSGKVEVPLELLYQLTYAAELLSRGARLKPALYPAWVSTHQEAKIILDTATDQI